MGRKIPGRKHRGVKDPEKQSAERFAKIKDKINAAPLNPDDQQISKSLSRIIELKNKVKEGKFNKKKRGNNEGSVRKQFKKYKGRPEKQIPKFERLPSESDREFKHRINRLCSEVIREAAFEDKFHVDIRRNEKGEVESVDKRPKDELELLVKKLKKEKKVNKNYKGKKKEKSNDEKVPRLTKSQKWSLKQAEKKKKKKSRQEEDYSFGPQREQVKFGEIVHAPPTLVAPKKVGKLEGAPRPGKKQLLLKSMLTNEKTNTVSNLSNKQNENNKKGVPRITKTIDKKAKRKNLPHALRRQLDKQQKEIIESYKLMKAKKYSTS